MKVLMRSTPLISSLSAADGQTHDYGFRFLNLEAVHYDFATAEHAKTILRCIDGGRVIEGDTSQGAYNYGPCLERREPTRHTSGRGVCPQNIRMRRSPLLPREDW